MVVDFHVVVAPVMEKRGAILARACVEHDAIDRYCQGDEMKITKWNAIHAAAASGALAMPFPAHAHHAMEGALPGNLTQGFLSGLAHPVIGLDHFLFVIALGVFCFYVGRRAGAVAAFVGGTLAGTGLHLYQANLAYPDAWVALTLVALGALMLARGTMLKSTGVLAFLGLAGIAHGYAYGESIVGAEATPLVAYLAGYTLIQLAVVYATFAAARYLDRKRPAFQGARALGAMVSVAGVAFLAVSMG